MMIRIRLLTLALAGLMACGALADALYIRADFAYSWAWDQSAKTVLDSPPPNESLVDFSLDGVPMGQLGFGYFWDPYMRFDVTGALTGGRVGHQSCSTTPSLCYPGTKGTLDINTSTLFANVYYELASLWAPKQQTRFHPYIGIGLGSAHHYMSDIEAELPIGGVTSSVSNHGQWQFAWRGTAGVAVTLTDNLLMDVAYVYMDAGEAATGKTIRVNVFPDPIYVKDPATVEMKTQELYIGLRHQFQL